MAENSGQRSDYCWFTRYANTEKLSQKDSNHSFFCKIVLVIVILITGFEPSMEPVSSIQLFMIKNAATEIN